MNVISPYLVFDSCHARRCSLHLHQTCPGTAMKMAKRYAHMGRSAQRRALALLDPTPALTYQLAARRCRCADDRHGATAGIVDRSLNLLWGGRHAIVVRHVEAIRVGRKQILSEEMWLELLEVHPMIGEVPAELVSAGDDLLL